MTKTNKGPFTMFLHVIEWCPLFTYCFGEQFPKDLISKNWKCFVNIHDIIEGKTLIYTV